MRKFTRNRTSDEEEGEEGKFLGHSIIKTSPKSSQSEVSPPRFVAKPISPHHPQNFRNASKYKEEREKRELAKKERNPREKLSSPSEKFGEEKGGEGKDNDDDASWDGLDSDDDDDDDDDSMPKSHQPIKNSGTNGSSKNPALNLNFSALLGHSEEEKVEQKKSESDGNKYPINKKGFVRQRSSSMIEIPSSLKQNVLETDDGTTIKANPKKPLSRRGSANAVTGASSRMNRRGSISGVLSIETDYDAFGKSTNLGEHEENGDVVENDKVLSNLTLACAHTIAFGTEVLTPKIAVPKMFRERSESPMAVQGKGKLNRRGSITNFLAGSIGNSLGGSFDAQESNKEEHHRKRSILKIGTNKLLEKVGMAGRSSPEPDSAGRKERSGSRERSGRERSGRERSGRERSGRERSGRERSGREGGGRRRSLRERSGRERSVSREKANGEKESPKESPKSPKEKAQRRTSLREKKRRSAGFKEDIEEIIEDDGGKFGEDDDDYDDESQGSQGSESLSESLSESESDEEDSFEDVTLTNDFWSHNAVKLRGGDKGRVRNTVRLDPYNVKRALDPETWNSIRYMEGVVVESGNGKMHGYYSCIICEDRIIFLPLSGMKFTEVVFREFGISGHIIMVPANEIMSCGYMRGEENTGMLWGNNEWNARSLHIKLNLLSQVNDAGDAKKLQKLAGQMHIYSFEQNSKVMFHICRMWIDCFTRMKARIPLVKEESEIEMATKFLEECERIVGSSKRAYQDHIHAMSHLASELINDITLKRLFFARTSVMSFAFHCIKDFEEDMAFEKGSKSRCLLVMRRIVVCFKLIYSVLFNSTAVSERYQFYFLGDTMLNHVAWYAKDFHTFIHNFVASTGFTPAKLTINDVKKLTNLRTMRRSMGLHSKVKRPGLMTRESMNAILDLDEVRQELAEEEYGRRVGTRKGKPRKTLQTLQEKRKSGTQQKSPRSPRSSRSPRENAGDISPQLSPRSVEENKEMFYILSDALVDYQVAVLVQLQDMVTNYNLECHNLQGRFIHEQRETVATKVKQAHEGFAEIEFNISSFFDILFQRMITLIDDIKSVDGSFAPTQNILDKLERLNFLIPNMSPRGHQTMEEISEFEGTKGLHKLNQPTIAMYNYSRLLYNLVNDDLFTREEAKMSGEEELKSFIGNKENISFFRRSGDVHLQLAVSFIKKTQNWMGIKGMGNDDDVEGGMFDLDDDFDIE
jgi:hypothetical protein